MARSLFLHIGSEKTGSTALQATLWRSRAKLASLGYWYPSSPGIRNHVQLAVLAAAANDVKTLMPTARKADDLEAERDAFRRSFRDEMAGLPGDIRSVVMSNEHCHSRLRTEAAIRRLADFLMPQFAEVKVHLYIRRQDALAVSLYSTRLKLGRREIPVFPKVNPEAFFYNYYNLVNAWSQVFGADNLVVHLYDRAALRAGDISADFLYAIGIAEVEGFSIASGVNRQIGWMTESVLLGFDEVRRAQGGHEALMRARRKLIGELGEVDTSAGSLPARAAAAAFLAQFLASNEKLRLARFPTRPQLFDADMGRYPEAAAAPDPVAFAMGRMLAGAIAGSERGGAPAADGPDEEAQDEAA